jgi:hypothetical protein
MPSGGVTGDLAGSRWSGWGTPGRELSLPGDRYGQVSVMSCGGLHPGLICRGRFGGFAGPPVIRGRIVRVTVTRLPDERKAAPGRLWPWRARYPGPGPALARLPPADSASSTPAGSPGTPRGWDKAALRHPGAGRPPDLAHHRRYHTAPASPAPSPKTTASAGNAAAARESSARPRPPQYPPHHATSSRRPPDLTQRVRTRKGRRPRTWTRHVPAADPRCTLPRGKERASGRREGAILPLKDEANQPLHCGSYSTLSRCAISSCAGAQGAESCPRIKSPLLRDTFLKT